MLKRMVWGNLLHRKTRTALTVCAIAVEVMMILLIVGVADGLIERSNAVKRGSGADVLVRPKTSGSAVSGGTSGIDDAQIDALRSAPDVAIVLPTVIKMQGDLVTINGLRLDDLSRMAGGMTFLQGAAPAGPYDVVVDTIYADQKGLAVNDTVRFINRDFRVSGIVQPGVLARVFLPYETLHAWNAEPPVWM